MRTGLARHPFLLPLLALALFGAAPAAAADSPGAPPPLERPVRLDLWGAGLADAIREIQAQTGVEVLVYPADLPAAETTGNLYLVSGRVGLGTIIDCLARRYAFRYRVSGAGRIEISRGYGWAAADPALRFVRLDAIVPPGGADVAAIRKFLGQFLKPLPLLPGDFSLALEKYPAPDNPNSLRAVLALPAVLADYLERAIKCLGGDPGDYPPDPARRERLFATAGRPAVDWAEFLARPIDTAPGGNVRKTLADAAAQAGAAFILQAPGPAGGRTAEVAAGRAGLGKFSEEMAARLNLGRRVFLPCGAVSFEPGGTGEWETDTRSRELYWGGLAVAGFAAGPAAGRWGGGTGLEGAIRREVFPGLWRDPATAAVYGLAGDRLVLIAPLDAVEAVAAKLREWGGK